MPREIELKWDLLARENYQRLYLRLGRPDSVRSQVNRYFDTPDFRLFAGGVMLRLRNDEGAEQAELTLKWGASNRDGLQECEELESQLSAEEAEAFDGDLDTLKRLHEDIHRRVAPIVGDHFLESLGRVSNLRRIYRRPDGTKYELDETLFPGGRRDWEIEVETNEPDRVRAEVEAFLGEWGIPVIRQEKSKFQRFLESR